MTDQPATGQRVSDEEIAHTVPHVEADMRRRIGDVHSLYVLDLRDCRAALASAEARLALAEQSEARTRVIAEARLSEKDEEIARLRTENAGLAQANYDYCMRAPKPSEAMVVGAAASIIDCMSGGSREWRASVSFPDCLGSTFLESADWQMALRYARAAFAVRPAAPDAPGDA